MQEDTNSRNATNETDHFEVYYVYQSPNEFVVPSVTGADGGDF